MPRRSGANVALLDGNVLVLHWLWVANGRG